MVAVTLGVLGSQSAAVAQTSNELKPEILMIGDSHLSFGARKVFQNFFEDFEKRCRAYETMPGHARAISKLRFALMGVKSTALHNWVMAKQRYKRMVCIPDPKWPVNARLYGFRGQPDGNYVQLGEYPGLPFCRQSLTPLQAVFKWVEPRLVVLYFMGNTIDRWAASRKTADNEVRALVDQLPPGTGCVFTTTSPVYRPKDNLRRLAAQRNIQAAFTNHKASCSFVPMLTPSTVAAIEGKAVYFRRHRDGRVKDPYHPGTPATHRLLSLQEEPFCKAVMQAANPGLVATID